MLNLASIFSVTLYNMLSSSCLQTAINTSYWHDGHKNHAAKLWMLIRESFNFFSKSLHSTLADHGGKSHWLLSILLYKFCEPELEHASIVTKSKLTERKKKHTGKKNSIWSNAKNGQELHTRTGIMEPM